MKALQYIVLTCCIVVLAGCEKFLEVGLPDTRISNVAVFKNDQTAIAAANGMYYALLQGHGILGGTVFNVTVMAGMSADEVADVSNFDVYATFYTNTLSLTITMYNFSGTLLILRSMKRTRCGKVLHSRLLFLMT